MNKSYDIRNDIARNDYVFTKNSFGLCEKILSNTKKKDSAVEKVSEKEVKE